MIRDKDEDETDKMIERMMNNTKSIDTTAKKEINKSIEKSSGIKKERKAMIQVLMGQNLIDEFKSVIEDQGIVNFSQGVRLAMKEYIKKHNNKN